jgi:lysophospholipase L1-like esterase
MAAAESSTPPARPSPPPASRPARRRVLLALTLALPWALLGAAEVTLRVTGIGRRPPLFVPYAEAPGWLMTNPDFARRYFAGSTFVPTPHVDFFRADKIKGTYRVFFQGESSAAGFPYGHGAAPSRILHARLAAAFPWQRIEVVNTAFTAVSSYTLLDQADEILAQRPDAVLIYAGHNEWYGQLGAASATGAGRSPALVRAYLAVQRSRLGYLLTRAVTGALGGGAAGPASSAAGGEAPGTVMELMAGERRVPLGSPVYDRGLAQFRGNLSALLARYAAHGVPVFIGTVVSNERDQRPFVSAPGAGGADAAWARARALEARGDTAGARAAYREAKERDELRFRAPDAINAIIREEAARHGAKLVESQRAVAAASPGGVPGATLLLEHLHPNVDGYLRIAEAFADALRAQRMPAPPPAPLAAVRAAVPITPVDSLAAVYRTDRLTAGWPFAPRGTVRPAIVDTLAPRTVAERLAAALVRGELPWAVATDRFRVAAAEAGDTAQAVRAARALAFEFPYTPKPRLDAAQLLASARRDREALAEAQLAVASEATPDALRLVALLALRLGDSETATAALEWAAARAPGDAGVRGVLAAVRMLPRLAAQRARSPRDTAVLYKLAAAYALTEQYDSARATLDALRAVDPAHGEGAALLAALRAR